MSFNTDDYFDGRVSSVQTDTYKSLAVDIAQEEVLQNREKRQNEVPKSNRRSSQREDFLPTYQIEIRTTSALHEHLYHADWKVRRDAIVALESQGKAAPASFISALRGLITHDQSTHVREAAVRALGLCGGKADRMTLLLAYADVHWNVRAAAIHVLSLLGEDAPKETIQQAVEEDRDAAVRVIAVWSLAALKDQASLASLLVALGDEDETVRVAAATVLREFPESSPLEALIWALEDENELVRAAATETMGKLGVRASVNALLPMIYDEDPFVRATAVEALGALGERVPLHPFLTALQDSEVMVRVAAVRAIGQQRQDTPIDALISALQDDDELVLSEIFEVLTRLNATISTRVSVEYLEQALQDPHAIVRSTVIWVLGILKSHTSLPGLCLALRDQEEEVRASAIWSLGNFAEVPVDLLTHALKDPSVVVRQAAIVVLGPRNNSGMMDALLNTLHDANTEVRLTAVATLGNLGERVPLEHLILALKDPTLSIPIQTILSHMNRSAYQQVSQTFLIQALHSDNPDVQAMAACIIREQDAPYAMDDMIEALALASFTENEQVRDATNCTLLHFEEMDDHPTKETAFIYTCGIHFLAEHHRTLQRQEEGILTTQAYLLYLLQHIEQKKGFVYAESLDETTLILNFCYQEEEKFAERTALSTLSLYFASNQRAHPMPAPSILQPDAMHMSTKVGKRPWSEMCMISLERSDGQPFAGKLMRIIVYIIAYRSVRANDTSIQEYIEGYFYAGKYVRHKQAIHADIEDAYQHILELNKMRFWYVEAPEEREHYSHQKNMSSLEERRKKSSPLKTHMVARSQTYCC